jgi:hypothetical protein
MTRSRAHDRKLLRPLHVSTNTPKSTAEEWCGVATHHTASTKAAQLRPTPGSNGEASPGVTVHGAKADKKRRKQCRQDATTDDDDGINERAGSSGVEGAAKATDHFEKLIGETCLNHAYPIKHKL